MQVKIPHSQPNLNSADIKVVSDVLKSLQIAQGKKITEFEKKFAKFQGCKKAVAVNSGTSALHLALIALGIKKNDEVIIPSFVCTALLNAVNYVQAKPVIADVNYDDFNISAKSAKKLITKRTKAIIIPHMFGMPADIKSLLKLKVPIIEDCAQSIGATYNGKKVGNFGVLSVFSFYATKVMTTGEGGMITSDNIKLLNKIKDLRDYDNKDTYKIRYNYKMTDFQAALGIEQLKKLPQMIKTRRKIAAFYSKNFKDLRLELPSVSKEAGHIYFRYVVKTKTNAKTFIQKFNKKGICASRPLFKPLHSYLKTWGGLNADKLFTHSVSIPINPNLKTVELNKIIKIAREIFK